MRLEVILLMANVHHNKLTGLTGWRSVVISGGHKPGLVLQPQEG
jgi:hypothetical protein